MDMDEHLSTKQMLRKEASSDNEDTIESAWLDWCRLCAKRSDAEQENSMIFSKDMNSTLTTSIGKYFWVNIKPEDEIPKKLCKKCLKLIDELIWFTERVNKVQTMYCILQNLKQTTVDAAKKLRSQFGLSDEGWEHIIKIDNEQQPLQKPEVVSQEVQTDLIIFFNKYCTAENTQCNKEIPFKDSINSAKTQSSKKQEEEELMEDSDTEQAQSYEYILNEDNDTADADSINNSEGSIKFKLKTAKTTTESIADVEDSDIFKELKFKVEVTEGDSIKKNPNSDKSIRLEILHMEENSDSEIIEISKKDPDEVGNDEDYVEILDECESFSKRKRGRPNMKSKGNTVIPAYQYNCPDCKRKYKNPTVFRKHMLLNHGEVVEQLAAFICSVCTIDCVTESSLRKHMRKHLPKDQKYTVPCPYCGKKFSQVAAMKTHVNGIHRQLKPFICDQCGRACKTLSALNEHQLVHTDECPFKCDVCQKGFKNKARLKSHIDTHTESEYQCPDCNLKLNTKRTLLQHRLVHSNVKRFKCQYCEAAFKRSKALKNHLILHTGLRPYKCPFCEKSFSNGSNCRSHKKRAHPVELAQEEALGIKSEPAPIPKLEDLKAGKDIVHHRVLRRHEKAQKETTDDFDDARNEENFYEIDDIQYEIEEELEADHEIEDDSQEFIEQAEETVIYEIIGEV